MMDIAKNAIIQITRRCFKRVNGIHAPVRTHKALKPAIKVQMVENCSLLVLKTGVNIEAKITDTTTQIAPGKAREKTLTRKFPSTLVAFGSNVKIKLGNPVASVEISVN